MKKTVEVPGKLMVRFCLSLELLTVSLSSSEGCLDFLPDRGLLEVSSKLPVMLLSLFRSLGSLSVVVCITTFSEFVKSALGSKAFYLPTYCY